MYKFKPSCDKEGGFLVPNEFLAPIQYMDISGPIRRFFIKWGLCKPVRIPIVNPLYAPVLQWCFNNYTAEAKVREAQTKSQGDTNG